MQLEDRGTPVRVALHTSCHARREMGVAPYHEQLLGQLSQVEQVSFARQRECCGFGGTFAVRHPEISAAMVSEKLDALAESTPELLVSGDGGCLMNIGGAAQKRPSGLATQHIASFIWERTHE